MQIFNQIKKYLILAIAGGSLYTTIEVFYRGYSHWTMFLLAAIIFCVLGSINEVFTWDMSLLTQGCIGALVVTVLEYICGIIVNVHLQWHIWDYSNMPFNLHGQICLAFSMLWIVLSIVAIVVDDYLRYLMFDEQIPKYRLFHRIERKDK